MPGPLKYSSRMRGTLIGRGGCATGRFAAKDSEWGTSFTAFDTDITAIATEDSRVITTESGFWLITEGSIV